VRKQVGLCNNIPVLYRQDRIQLICNMAPIRIELDDATAIGIIITELVNNAYLHAFPDNLGEISVALTVEAGQATLMVIDNGIGFVEVETLRRGMTLVRRLVKQVGGLLTLQPHQGAMWTMVWPVREVAPLPGE
jgi:two-component sensor histidine kinase